MQIYNADTYFYIKASGKSFNMFTIIRSQGGLWKKYSGVRNKWWVRIKLSWVDIFRIIRNRGKILKSWWKFFGIIKNRSLGDVSISVFRVQFLEKLKKVVQSFLTEISPAGSFNPLTRNTKKSIPNRRVTVLP